MEVFDRAVALHRAGGDAERLEDLLEDFQIKLPAWMAAIEKAVDKRRAGRVTEIASELHRAAHEIAAEGMAALAAQVREAADEGDFDAVSTYLTHMGMEHDWLCRVLDENRCSGNL